VGAGGATVLDRLVRPAINIVVTGGYQRNNPRCVGSNEPGCKFADEYHFGIRPRSNKIGCDTFAMLPGCVRSRRFPPNYPA